MSAIRLSDLRAAQTRAARASVVKSLGEARRLGRQTAFLCHSHKDHDLAEGLQVLFVEQGWEVYIDWQDTALPDTPDAETARKIKSKIEELDWFLFLATPNSVVSRWCPWEIGYADKSKSHDKVLIVPTQDQSGTWYGNEYLKLYGRVEAAGTGGLAAFSEGARNGSWVRNLSG